MLNSKSSTSWDRTGSNTGPRDFSLSYSTNGTTFAQAAVYSLTGVTWSATSPAVGSSYSSSVAGASNVSNVIFRLIDTSSASIGGGVVASGGTNRVDNFTVNAVPEPGTWALMLAGIALVGTAINRGRVRS